MSGVRNTPPPSDISTPYAMVNANLTPTLRRAKGVTNMFVNPAVATACPTRREREPTHGELVCGAGLSLKLVCKKTGCKCMSP